ncbi:hypothetical protein D3C81_2060530 [compost metagenome]
MLLHDILGDEQAQPGAAFLVRARPIAGEEHVEHVRQLVRRNGIPIVGDAHDNLSPVQRHADVEVFTVFAVTDGIGQQVL